MKKTTTGIGRRKTAIAQVKLLDHGTEQLVNRQPIEQYFPTVEMQSSALAPLRVTSQNQLSFSAQIHGGGKRSQADALKLALARALVQLDHSWHKQLREGGLLTRDPRMKERKKYGLKRARRAPQFSKR